MLRALRGKRLVFVGDSLNRNMWESLLCILRHPLKRKHRVFEVSGRKEFRTDNSYAFRFEVRGAAPASRIDSIHLPFALCRRWRVSFMHLLLANRAGLQLFDRVLPVAVPGAGKLQGGIAGEEQGNAPAGFDRGVVGCLQDRRHPRLQLGPLVDAREDLERVAPAMLCVFLWGRRNFYQEGDHVYPQLSAEEAYRKAMRTWGTWVDTRVNSNRTRVFFRGYSWSHFR
ncbi:hypothetical protein B296_00055737 [Ensete ventricosum]|uniref:Trichome birefringence-like C-terminal domain-containing protein n=1 Tax=Ensete ventricosum TaxID=4639 RepID=A0A426XYS7_ENSVE|nr:hypothetical protein B296_00055737 [Ensete ventricosum]